MPFYLPWFTIIGAVLIALSVIAADSNCGYYLAVPAFIAAIIAVLLKLPRLLVLLCLPVIFTFTSARNQTKSPNPDDLSLYLNHNVVFTGSLLSDPQVCGSSKFGNTYSVCLKIDTLIFPDRKKLSGFTRLIITSKVDQAQIQTQAQGQTQAQSQTQSQIQPQIQTKIRTRTNASCQYRQGQILQIRGKVYSIDQSDQPWLSELNNAYSRRNIFCQIHAYAGDLKTLGTCFAENSLTKRIDLVIDSIRQRIAAAHIQFLGAKTGSLFASMVLGDQAVELDCGLMDAFRKVGLSHILAASGFNLTVVTMMTYWILRNLCSDKRLVTAIVCGNVIVYAVLAGLSVSIIRAAITCLLVLMAKYFNRRLHGLATLSFGLIINVIADPTAVIEPGGQLSYAATAGIICGAEVIASVISFGSNNKFIQALCSTLAVVLIAQLAVLPVQLFHFWQIGLLFLPANLLIDPLVTPVTVAGFLASIAAIANLPGLPLGLALCRLLDWLAAIPLQIIIYVAEKLAAFDLSVLNAGRPMTVTIIFYYVTFSLWLLCLHRKRFRLISTILFVCSLSGLFYQPRLAKPVIVLLPHSIICINNHRQAYCYGGCDHQANKVLAFYGAKAENAWKSCEEKISRVTKFQLYSSEREQILCSVVGNYLLLTVYTKKAQEIRPLGRMYIILLKRKGGFSTYHEKQKIFIESSISLSRTIFNRQLENLDLKVCIPNQSVNYYLVQ